MTKTFEDRVAALEGPKHGVGELILELTAPPGEEFVELQRYVAEMNAIPPHPANNGLRMILTARCSDEADKPVHPDEVPPRPERPGY